MPYASVADTLYDTTALGAPPEVETKMFDGHVMVGGTVSLAVTSNEQKLVLLALSVTWHCTPIVDSRGIKVGLETLQVAGLRMPEASDAVGAVNRSSAVVPPPDVKLSVIEAPLGHVIIGGDVSTTSKTKEQFELKRALSKASQKTGVLLNTGYAVLLARDLPSAP